MNNINGNFTQNTFDPNKTIIKINPGGGEIEMLMSKFIENLNIPVIPETPYKVYRALLTQADAANPSVTVLENTLTFTPNWVRNSAGNYLIDNQTITASSAGVLLSPLRKAGSAQITYFGPGYLLLTTLNTSNVAADGTSGSEYLNNTFIEIKIY